MTLFDLANHRRIRIGKLTRLHSLHVPDKTRNLHVRIAGEPGTGKTMLAAYIAFQDALREIPLIVIDGKGQLINALIKLIVSSDNRDELLVRLLYVPFNRTDYVHGFPFLQRSGGLDAYNASQAFIEVVMRVNPTLEQVATTLRQIGTASLMAIYEMGWQITEVLSFLHDQRVREQVLDEVGDRQTILLKILSEIHKFRDVPANGFGSFALCQTVEAESLNQLLKIGDCPHDIPPLQRIFFQVRCALC